MYNKNDILYLLLNYVSSHWDFPKGNKEKDETDIETAIRETKEETGISDLVFINGFKKNVFYNYKRNNILISKKVIYYLAKTNTSTVVLSNEHTGYKWYTYNDALAKITYQNSRNILRESYSFLQKISGL